MHYSWFYPLRTHPRLEFSRNTQRATGHGPTTHYKNRCLNGDCQFDPETGSKLVEALTVLVSDFLQALATSSSFDALLFFRRLFEALTLLDIGNDAILFAGLGETLESAFKRFVGLNNYADHDYPLVKLEIRFWIAKYI